MMPCQIIIFPMSKRVGRIREVADKLLDKQTIRAAEHYRKVVTKAAVVHLDRASIPPRQQQHALAEFWRAVTAELDGQCSTPRNSGGAA